MSPLFPFVLKAEGEARTKLICGHWGSGHACRSLVMHGHFVVNTWGALRATRYKSKFLTLEAERLSRDSMPCCDFYISRSIKPHFKLPW